MQYFDQKSFELLQAGLKAKTFKDNTIQGLIRPATIAHSLCSNTHGHVERWRQIGTEALKRGEVACVILAGGMATRFGGVVKANVPVVHGQTFLEMKLNDVAMVQRQLNCKVPVWLMTSFATDEAIKEVLEKRSFAKEVDLNTFEQNVSYRMDLDGNIFHELGAPSAYAPGHGDLPDAVQRCSGIRNWIDKGGKWILMSNVDNVGATLDPGVIGLAIVSEAQMLVEVVKKYPGDKGGAAGVLDGRLQIIEAFRFPNGFDQDQLPHFNTNTIVFEASCLLKDYDLTWFRVEKKVGDQTVVQFERLVGELTAHLKTEFLEVPRTFEETMKKGGEQMGEEHSRFIPIKEPQDLQKYTKELERVAAATQFR